MADAWYYLRDGRKYGPFGFEQLRQLADSGLLGPEDMVLDEPTGRWASAAAVPGLTPAPPAASAPLGDAPVGPPPEPVRLEPIRLSAAPPSPPSGIGARSGRMVARSRAWQAVTWMALLGFILMLVKTAVVLYALSSGAAPNSVLPALACSPLFGVPMVLGGLAWIATGARALRTGTIEEPGGVAAYRPVANRLVAPIAIVLGVPVISASWDDAGVRDAATPARGGPGAAEQARGPLAAGPFLSFGPGEEVHYSEGMGEQADRLGRALKEVGYLDGSHPARVRLGRPSGRWVVDLYVTDAACRAPVFQAELRRWLGFLIGAAAMPGEDLEIRLWDEGLAPRASIAVEAADRVAIGQGGWVVFRGPLRDDAEALAEHLRGQLDGRKGVIFLLSRRGGVRVITGSLRGAALASAEVQEAFRGIANDVAERVFDRAPVMIELLDQSFQVVYSYSTSELPTDLGGGTIRQPVPF